MLSSFVLASGPVPLWIALWRCAKFCDMRGQKFGIGQRVKMKVSTNGRP